MRKALEYVFYNLIIVTSVPICLLLYSCELENFIYLNHDYEDHERLMCSCVVAVVNVYCSHSYSCNNFNKIAQSSLRTGHIAAVYGLVQCVCSLSSATANIS